VQSLCGELDPPQRTASSGMGATVREGCHGAISDRSEVTSPRSGQNSVDKGGASP
jgi:hypothetical protein